ncbi:MAG: sodium/proline symporter PutP [Butyricicoccaceae bacterium]
MTTAKICILIAIVAYLLLVLGIGIWCARRSNTVDDFYLGGRRLGPLVTAMSAEASDMSGWLLMGLPGVAYLTGVADAAWTAIGLSIGTYINWLVVAKRIRRYTDIAGNSITIPDFFSRRYRDNKNILMCIAAIVIIVFFIPYTASGFAACGKLFSSLFGIDYFVAMVICAVVILGYTTLGGFLAASTTDFIQSIVMSIALLVVLGFGVSMAGGIDAVVENAKQIPGYLSLTNIYVPDTDSSASYGLLSIVSTLAWGLGYFGMPHILLRFMAIDDVKKLTLSRRVATTWVIISLAVAVMIGVIGNGMTSAGVIEALADPETIIVRISDLLSQFGVLPALIAGVILAGILASTMSTADSQLLAASSSISHNLFRGVFRINLSERAAMVVARVSVIVIAVVGVFLASDPNSSVFGIVSFAWAGFGASFGPVVLFSLFWRRSNMYGALAGMVSGGAMVFIWKYLVRPLGGAWNIYELLPAFLVACAAIVIVSLITPPPSQEICDEFDRVNQMKN